MSMIAITDKEFAFFQRFIHEEAGITLSLAKKPLVCGRLGKRLNQHDFRSYTEYFNYLKSGQSPAEVQMAIDLLTTNETYFFREPKHFELLRELATAAKARSQPFRVWSAASSSGEEAYSIAMVLADCIPSNNWEIMGSDISLRVLERARCGHYPMERTKHIPLHYLKRFCLRGIGEQEGTLLIERSLRSKVEFLQVNLNEKLPDLGKFDVIFLRNVMIYFNGETKQQIVARVLSLLKPGGHFCIGHSESLNGISDAVQPIAPSIYRNP
ncbi:protein-glutamate O-methyltransferase CheR [Uliginosibacterium sp. H3]|uniref:Chemotaxis protein methyltransferase n=1 Tax=Uliginosibacterium silvisoli TaxID=3114758 RepID=A0ABU6K1X2_9RHOO|nr:protein-glutamate O-methyltransferase CheR [Uliginosibacterium sp. H3]